MDRNDRAGLIAAIGRDGAAREFGRSVRSLVTGALRHPLMAARFIRDSHLTEEVREREFATWVTPETVAIDGGAFFGMDLRCWLALAAAAGVPAVPAQEVLTLTDSEMDALSGRIDLSPLVKPYEQHRRQLADAILAEFPEMAHAADSALPAVTPEALRTLHEKLAVAMDDLPADVMIRSVETGPSVLKVLAGVGAIADRAPEVPPAPGETRIGIGPGWIRIGNRRVVQVGEARALQAHFDGPMDADHVFVARPWIRAARWLTGRDPHLAGTVLEDEAARWPAEWRAFVYDGKVTGVSAYYAWAGRTTPQDARVALQVRELAQRIADTATALRAFPRIGSVETARHGPIGAVVDADLPREGVHATIDFIEAIGADGRPTLLMLEAGPPHHPMLPGGHPCGFTGIAMPDGVAFRTMDGVDIADPYTWQYTRAEIRPLRQAAGSLAAIPDKPGINRDGAVLDWQAVAALAAQPDTAPAGVGHDLADGDSAPTPG